MVQLVYKQRNNLMPDVFDSYFKPRNEFTTYKLVMLTNSI